MFPIMPTSTFDHPAPDARVASKRETKPSSRIDVQRQLLEHAKMYPHHSMIVDQKALDRDRDLVHRQMIAEARGNRVSLTSKFRHSFGGALISIGERIRPQFTKPDPTQFAKSEPTFNA